MAPILSLLVSSLLVAPGFAGVFEKLPGIPEGWKFETEAAGDQKLKLQIALKQGDAPGFEQWVLDISTPSHPSYGLHFDSHDEMKRMLLPSQETSATVTAWLKKAGIEDFELDADWLSLRTTVGKANQLLDTRFGWYISEEAEPRKILRTLEYSLPDEVAEHVNLVQPTTHFTALRSGHSIGTGIVGYRLATRAEDQTDCNSVASPECLKTLYKIDYKPDPKSGSKVAFASYLEQYARYDDLVLFEKKFLPEDVGQDFSVVEFNGGQNHQTGNYTSEEANLDVQCIVGMSSPLPVTEYSVGGRGPNRIGYSYPDGIEPYLEFLQGVLKLPQEDLPQVISTSYGGAEQLVPKPYALTVCNLFAQLGSRGVSVIFASCDSGVGTYCESNDGKHTLKFQPMFPAACPFVTSVGSTQFLNQTAAFFSSGGFSDYWPRPSYQDKAVSSYLEQLGDRFKPYFNRSGRGFPDVSAQGVGLPSFDYGRLISMEGTSASAPTFAGIVALLNDARLRAQKAPLGFLNPLLYAHPDALYDVVLGGSTGCNGHGRFHGPLNGSPVIPYASWNATKGWDPVSGLGTPNFPALMQVVLPSRVLGGSRA